jgi:RNA polymerase sigma-70 factor, ECF subfamily
MIIIDKVKLNECKNVMIITSLEDSMHIFEKKLIKSIKKGDQSAFERLVEMYKDKVFHLAYRMLKDSYEAEDIAQEAFVRVYLNIEKYDEKYKFSTWIYRIATNLAIDRIRKKKADYSLDEEVTGTDGLTLYSQIPSDDELPDRQVEFIETKDLIEEQISKLPLKYRTAITLRYLEELSMKEISEIMDLPVATVKTRIHRGREALRKSLGTNAV